MKKESIFTALLLFIILCACSTHKTIETEARADTLQTKELRTDSIQNRVHITDSIRWITRTKDSVNVFRMIVLTQNEQGKIIGTHEKEQTYVYHSEKDSTAYYKDRMQKLERKTQLLQDSLRVTKEAYNRKETVEKPPNLYTRIATAAFPWTLILLVLAMIWINVRIKNFK